MVPSVTAIVPVNSTVPSPSTASINTSSSPVHPAPETDTLLPAR